MIQDNKKIIALGYLITFLFAGITCAILIHL